jgi:chromosome segregation ATPase
MTQTLIYSFLCIFAIVAFYLMKRDISGMRKDMQSLIEKLSEFIGHSAKTDEKIEKLSDKIDRNEIRINDIVTDVRELTRKQSKCHNFDPRP